MVKLKHWRGFADINVPKGAPVLVVEWGFRSACGSPTRRLPNAVGSANCKFYCFMLVSIVYGSDNPDRALTAEISDELIAPDAFTSNLKFNAVVA